MSEKWVKYQQIDDGLDPEEKRVFVHDCETNELIPSYINKKDVDFERNMIRVRVVEIRSINDVETYRVMLPNGKKVCVSEIFDSAG